MEVEDKIMSEIISAAATEKEVEAPSEIPTVVEPTTPEIITPEEVQEFELPDGRKVDAQGLEEEYHKLLPEFTRRSQRLAELEKNNPIKLSEPEKQKAAPWEDPNWQPKTWQEVFEAGKQATLKEVSPILSEIEQAKTQRQVYDQAQKAINEELTVLRTKDPKINETELFKHANKGFSSLTAAYNDLQERKGLEKNIEARVLKNIKLREDPVANSSATSPEDDTPSYHDISSYRNVRDAAAAAFAKIRK